MIKCMINNIRSTLMEEYSTYIKLFKFYQAFGKSVKY